MDDSASAKAPEVPGRDEQSCGAFIILALDAVRNEKEKPSAQALSSSMHGLTLCVLGLEFASRVCLSISSGTR